MKRMFLTLIGGIAITAAFSQVRLGVEAGLNLANQHVKASVGGFSAGQTGNTIASFHLGFVADAEIAKNLYVRPKLLLSGKGSRFKNTSSTPGVGSNVTFRPYYLELPINVVYKYPLSNHMKVFAGFGPNFAFGIFGNAKSGDMKDDVFQKDGFKRFDFGLEYLAGVELTRNIVASIHYTQGLSNIYNGSNTGISSINWKNRLFGISFGYMFDK